MQERLGRKQLLGTAALDADFWLYWLWGYGFALKREAHGSRQLCHDNLAVLLSAKTYLEEPVL
jgi:hypothetical protein